MIGWGGCINKNVGVDMPCLESHCLAIAYYIVCKRPQTYSRVFYNRAVSYRGFPGILSIGSSVKRGYIWLDDDTSAKRGTARGWAWPRHADLRFRWAKHIQERFGASCGYLQCIDPGKESGGEAPGETGAGEEEEEEKG